MVEQKLFGKPPPLKKENSYTSINTHLQCPYLQKAAQITLMVQPELSTLNLTVQDLTVVTCLPASFCIYPVNS